MHIIGSTWSLHLYLYILLQYCFIKLLQEGGRYIHGILNPPIISNNDKWYTSFRIERSRGLTGGRHAMAITSKGGDACWLPLSCQFWRSCLTPFQRCNKYGRNFASDIYYKNQLARYIMIFSNYWFITISMKQIPRMQYYFHAREKTHGLHLFLHGFPAWCFLSRTQTESWSQSVTQTRVVSFNMSDITIWNLTIWNLSASWTWECGYALLQVFAMQDPWHTLLTSIHLTYTPICKPSIEGSTINSGCPNGLTN